MHNERKDNQKRNKTNRKEQNRLFRKRLNALFKTEYRFSTRYEETHIFDDGKAYINVDLTKTDSPFSIYSYNNRLNPEIYDYINQETLFLPVDIPVVVNFDDNDKYDDEMKTKIKKCVIRHYSLEYEDIRYELRRSRLFGVVTLIIGLLLLSLYVVSSIIFKDKVPINSFNEVIYILSWVFVWEATDRFVLSGYDRTVDVLNAGQLALIEVQFGKPKIKK